MSAHFFWVKWNSYHFMFKSEIKSETLVKESKLKLTFIKDSFKNLLIKNRILKIKIRNKVDKI